MEEQMRQTRFSEADPDFDQDGVTPDGLALNSVATIPLKRMKKSRRAIRAQIRLGLARQMATQTRKRMMRSGAVVLVSYPDSSPRGKVSGGRAMLAVWLAATRAGLAVQPENFPLFLDDLRSGVADVFGVDPSRELVTVMRIGRSSFEPPPSMRLPFDRICSVQDSSSVPG
jgi:hypothetical protein